MALSFLVPAALAAAALAAVPVALHFLRRGRARPVVFPAAMFLRGAGESVSRGRRAAEWALMALRALAAAACAALAAGPVLRGLGDPAKRSAAVVFAIDDSMSMAAGPEGRAPLDRSVAMAAETLEGLAPGSPAGAVLFSGRRLAPTADPAAVRGFLESVRPSCAEPRAAAAVAEARRMLAGRTGAREVVVFSDFGSATWRDRPPGASGGGPALVAVDLAPAGGAGWAVWRAAPLARRVYRGVEAPFAVFVRRGAAGPGTAAVTVSAAGRVIHSARVSLGPGESTAVLFRASFPAAGPVSGTARVDADDGSAADNEVPFAVEVHPPARVLAVEPAERGPRAEAEVLLAALSFAAPGDPAFARADIAVPEELPDRVLSEYQAVAVTHGSRLSGPAWAALSAFAGSGRGAIVFMDAPPPPGPPAEAFAALAVRASPPRRAAREGLVLAVPPAAPPDHPAAAFRGGMNGGIDLVPFHRVTPLAPAAASASTLLALEDGTPAVIEARLGRGRVLLAAFGPGPEWSGLADSPAAYFVLLHELLARAAAVGASSLEARGGETVAVDARPGETRLAMRGPGRGTPARLALDPVGRRAEFAAPDERGVIEIDCMAEGSEKPARTVAVAVAPPATEAAEAPLPPEARRELLDAMGASAVAAGEDDLRALQSAAGPGLDAAWLPASALAALFLVEMFLANRTERSRLRKDER